MTDEQEYRDLRDRTARAAKTLATMLGESHEPSETVRIHGKIEGVNLVLSYIDETMRLRASSAPATTSEGATEGERSAAAALVREVERMIDRYADRPQSAHELPGALRLVVNTYRRATRAATGVTSSDGGRGLSEEERRSLGCQCTRLDGVWHHVRGCPAPAVERILAARTARPEGPTRPL